MFWFISFEFPRHALILVGCSLAAFHTMCHRAAGYDTEKPLNAKQTLICCHLYNAWRQLDKSLSAEETNVSFAITPQDKRFTSQKAEEIHSQVYTAWQSPDENTLGWLIRNYERKKYQVNDLSKVASQTAEPCDPTFVKNAGGQGKQVLSNEKGKAVWIPLDDAAMEHINYKAWLRRLDLYLVAEHLVGFKIYPDGTWVTPKQLNLYRSHVGQHVIHGPPSMQMPFRAAQRADLSIRGKWMELVREGKKLGEAIELSLQFMHVKMTYVMVSNPVSSGGNGLTEKQVYQMINDKMKTSRSHGNAPVSGSRSRAQVATPRSQPSRRGDRRSLPRPPSAYATPKKTIHKKGPKKHQDACRLFNAAEGCQRRDCRFSHFCTKCRKASCKKGASNCTG
jgi:hypothetical protein